MATSSIYTSVKVKNKNDCRKLLVALETAESKKAKEVVFSRSVEIVKGDKIKELFKCRRVGKTVRWTVLP